MSKNDEINIYLVRHGEAGKSWDEDLDPGLSDKGKEQSRRLVSQLEDDLALLNFKAISSPLARAQETAIPLQEKHGFDIEIYKSFAEIPSPGRCALVPQNVHSTLSFRLSAWRAHGTAAMLGFSPRRWGRE